MGLLTVLRKVKQKECEVRVLLLGLDNAGKTTLLKRLVGELTVGAQSAYSLPAEAGPTGGVSAPGNGAGEGSSTSRIGGEQPQNDINSQQPNITTTTTTTTTESTSSDTQFAQSNTDPTLGFNIRTLLHGGFKINVWDIGGQKSIRSYWRNYFDDTDAIIWVIDSADVSDTRLLDARAELHKVLSEDRIQGAPLLILCNKQDLNGALTPQEVVDSLEVGSIVCETRHWNAVGCSAATESVRPLIDGIDWLVTDISHRIYLNN